MVEDFDRGDEEAESQTHNGVQGNVELPLREASPEILVPMKDRFPCSRLCQHINCAPRKLTSRSARVRGVSSLTSIVAGHLTSLPITSRRHCSNPDG